MAERQSAVPIHDRHLPRLLRGADRTWQRAGRPQRHLRVGEKAVQHKRRVFLSVLDTMHASPTLYTAEPGP